jgi:hypothetical protein
MLQLENLAEEIRENTMKPILNMDLLIPLLIARSAQCLICCKILANFGMKPIKLVRHIVKKHVEFKNKPTDFS